MFSLKLAKGRFFDSKAVLKAFSKAERKGLSKFGAFVRTKARSLISRRRKAASPGAPPSSHVGTLKRLIFFAADIARHGVTIGPILGGSKSGAPEVLEKSGVAKIAAIRAGKRSTRRVKIAARPFMAPAFKSEQRQLPSIWRNSVKS